MRTADSAGMNARRSARPCSVPGCPHLTTQGSRCVEHTRQAQREHDATRQSPSRRGYDAEWVRIRGAYLADHPGCEWSGCRRSATDVHHRLALRNGGTHVDENLMALCHAHHSAITGVQVQKMQQF